MDSTEEARAFLQSVRGTWPEVVESTGLNYQWISKFAQGVIKSPSARLIDAVLGYKSARAESDKAGGKAA